MPEIAYHYPLDDEGLNWYRFRIVTDRSRLILFTVQFETIIVDRHFPVVRFDNAHGFPHRDRLNRRGDVVEKTALTTATTLEEAAKYAELDIRTNWRRYLKEFLGELS